VRLALYQPDIPQNLGAALRLSACLGVALDVIEPCGFPLTDASMKRAALDYGDKARVARHIPHPDDARRIIGVGVLFLFESDKQQKELMNFIIRNS